MRTEARIEAITATPFSIPYREPVVWAYGELVAGDHVLLECRTDDGHVGWAEAIPRLSIYGESQDSLVDVARDVLAPRLVGRRLWDPELTALVHRGITNNNVARGAMEQALWCTRSVATGMPLRWLLGGGPDRIPVGWMLGLAGEDAMVAEGAEAYERGYRSFKIKGGSDADHDVAVYRRLREALPDASLYIDANLGYDWTDALRVARALAPHGLRWIEEPLAAGDPMRTQLFTQTGVAILADETATTARAAWEQIRDGAAQIISIKVSRTGVAESQRIAALCAAAGIPIVVGTQGESALGTHLAAEVTAALGAARLLTTELSHDQVFTGQIATTGVTRAGSELHLSSTPSELTIDRNALAAYAR